MYFINQKEACEARNLKSRSFTRAIQQNSISSGHYWNFLMIVRANENRIFKT
jgi:hypothetical protein